MGDNSELFKSCWDDPNIVRGHNGVVESLNGHLIYRACEKAKSLGRDDVKGWLSLIDHANTKSFDWMLGAPQQKQRELG